MRRILQRQTFHQSCFDGILDIPALAIIDSKNDETSGLCACEKEERDRPKHLQRHPCNGNRKCPVNPCLHNGHWNVNNVGRVPGRPRERP